MKGFGNISGQNKRQKLDPHDTNNNSNSNSHGPYVNPATAQPMRVPVHLLALVSEETRNFIVPEPLPNSVSHLKPPSYSVRKYLSNMAILRVYEILNMVSLSVRQAMVQKQKSNNEAEFLKTLEPSIMIIDKMFAPYGSIHYAISPTASNSKIRTFELSVLSFLFFFREWIGNMRTASLEMFVNNLKAQVLNNGTIYVESNEFTVMKNYPDGSRTIKKFNIKVIFDSWLKIEFLELVRIKTDSFASGESLSLKHLNKNDDMDQLLQFILDRKLNKTKPTKRKFDNSQVNPDLGDIGTGMPDITRGNLDTLPFPNYMAEANPISEKDGANNEEGNEEGLSNSELMVNFIKQKNEALNLDTEYSTPVNFLKFLQLSDVMTNLKTLMLYQRINNVESPMDSMFRFVNDLRKRERDLLNKG